VTPPDFACDERFVHSEAWLARLTVLAYIAALIGADALARPFSIEVSQACYAGLLLGLLTHSALVSPAHPRFQVALASLALVPTLKLGAVVLPQRVVPDEYWEIFPAALALATVIALRKLGGIPRNSTSLRRGARFDLRVQLPIAATGPPFALAAAVVLSALDLTPGEPGLTTTPVSVFVVAAFSGLTLEIVFRGVIQPSLVEVFGPLAIVPVSLLYAGIFLDSGSAFIVVLGLVSGLVWGLFTYASGRVSGVSASHALFALSWTVLY
jgi:membrane protease YdiL (CAAX protease family)